MAKSACSDKKLYCWSHLSSPGPDCGPECLIRPLYNEKGWMNSRPFVGIAALYRAVENEMVEADWNGDSELREIMAGRLRMLRGKIEMGCTIFGAVTAKHWLGRELEEA
jgi:hypothetical protein